MTHYKHRLTLAVPEALMECSNNLALIMGESSADVNTFTTADWQDVAGNKYAVASAVGKPSVISALVNGLPDPLPSHAEGADVALAQQALDAIVDFNPVGNYYDPVPVASPDVIVLAVDYDPLTALAVMGLERIYEEIE